MLLSWEFVDFGQRKAGVDVARAQESLVQARAELTELDTTAAAADAFLTVLAADEAARAAQANVDRLQVFADAVRTLVRNELRPGADESRADAELAVAKNALSQAIQVSDIARASLAENIGAAGMGVEPLPGRVAQLPEILSEGVADVKTHPAARAGSAAIEATRARERQLARSLFPRLTVQSAIAARGSGSPLEGQVVSGDGLWPKVQNWATGITVTVPLLETFSVASRKRVEIQNELAETARYDQTIQGLTTQEMRARALLKAATDIARNTPFQLKAAADAERRARAIPEWTGDHHRGCGGAAVAGAGRSGQCAGPARHVASHVGGRPGPRRSDAVPGEDPTLNHRYECLGEDECG